MLVKLNDCDAISISHAIFGIPPKEKIGGPTIHLYKQSDIVRLNRTKIGAFYAQTLKLHAIACVRAGLHSFTGVFGAK
jgi:hypothetical protein